MDLINDSVLKLLS